MSKKLQGNGLWESSRMLLPQHKEQSLLASRSPSEKKAPSLTGRDTEMIRQLIVLPLVLQIVENKLLEMDQSRQTLKSLYAAAAKLLSLQLRRDIGMIKRELLGKQIRVAQHNVNSEDDAELSFSFTHCSRQNRLTMTRDFLKAAVSLALSQYINRLIAQMRESWSRE